MNNHERNFIELSDRRNALSSTPEKNIKRAIGPELSAVPRDVLALFFCDVASLNYPVFKGPTL